jgi:hypothetical protein
MPTPAPGPWRYSEISQEKTAGDRTGTDSASALAIEKHWRDYSTARNEVCARTHTPMAPWTVVLATQTIAALIAGFGWLIAPIPWSYVELVWLYCLVWFVVEDRVKLLVYRHLEMETPRHRRFLAVTQGGLHHHPQRGDDH